jgi:hypothetical protein
MLVLAKYGVKWTQLPAEVQNGLKGRLAGLYGQADDAAAFDSLGVDKKNALLILHARLSELGLWKAVRRVENVYGQGGVGMNFKAWPVLVSTLKRRKEFTSRFASHGDNAGGFMEKSADAGSLHFLYDDEAERKWAVHFDLFNPWSSPLNAWRHLREEKLRGYTPDWTRIGQVLGFRLD